MVFRTVWSSQPRPQAIAGARSPRALARTIWQRRRVMAYVYGMQRLEWDTPAGEHRTVDAAYLQVWRQETGEWRLAARIAHPLTPDT
jgi:hypothetical protein